MRTCTNCKKNFQPTNHNQKQCGTQKCYWLTRKIKECFICRKPTSRPMYCSDECNIKAQKDRRGLLKREQQLKREHKIMESEVLLARAKGEV